MRTRVKICGITRVEDALAAAAAGADAIGIVFAPGPRRVTAGQAQRIVCALPPFVTAVGLFVDAAPQEVRAVLGAVALDLLQFHGSETPDYCRQFAKSFIKAVPMREGVDLHQQVRVFAGAAGLVLDTFKAGTAGGTGQTFDWDRIPRDLAKPVILAGGLSSDNVAEAVRRVRPYAVDVSSGVEVAKGVKDPDRIAAFVEAVRTA